LLAKTAAQAGKNDLAIEEYEQLARAQRQSPEIAVQLGLAHQAKGDLAGAVEEFERARSLAPKNALVYAFLGKAQDDLGRKTPAIASYRQSLSLDNRNPWVMNNLAYLLAETGGDLREAMTLAKTAAHNDPNNASFSDTVGSIYLKQMDFSSAIHVFQGLTDKKPKDVSFRIHLGEAWLASGDRNRGRAELQVARALATTTGQRGDIEKLLGGTDRGQ
jgi:Flp pilus assembly protein TadD